MSLNSTGLSFHPAQSKKASAGRFNLRQLATSDEKEAQVRYGATITLRPAHRVIQLVALSRRAFIQTRARGTSFDCYYLALDFFCASSEKRETAA